MNRRIPEIDGARCLCNYLIVLHHSFTVSQFCGLCIIEYEVWNVIHNITHSTLAALFFVSGYCMALGYSESQYWKKVKRRLLRLGVPFIAWNFIFIIIYCILAMHVPLMRERLEAWGVDSVNGFFTHMFNPMLRPADGPLWFIRTLLFYALAFPLVWRIFEMDKCVVLLVLIGMWFFLSTFFGWERQLLYSFPVYSLFAFIFGSWCARGNFALSRLTSGNVIIVCAMVLIVRCLFGSSSELLGSWIWELNAMAGIPVWLALGKWLAVRVDGNGIYESLKGVAYFVYAGHILVCPFISHGLARIMRIDFHGKMSLLAVAYAIGGVLVCWGVKKVLARRAPFIAKLLNGEL